MLLVDLQVPQLLKVILMKTTHFLVGQLKAYAFDVDLFQSLEKYPSIESKIRKMLKKLSGQELPESTVPFMIDFKPLFDRMFLSVAEK